MKTRWAGRGPSLAILKARVIAAMRRGREAEFARRCALIDRTGIAGLI